MGSTMPKSPVSNAWGARGAFSDPTDFFEALNLFVMFCTALGLATAVAVTEFLLLWRPKR